MSAGRNGCGSGSIGSINRGRSNSAAAVAAAEESSAAPATDIEATAAGASCAVDTANSSS